MEQLVTIIRETLSDDGCLINLKAEKLIRCKDCKHWKDSDGVYRRGIGAESKCPINIQSVYDGTFYCGMAERREDES